jgi:hypothetical protein
MIISFGNVGIGTRTPQQSLDVNGNIRAFNAANDVMGLFATSYGGYLHIGAWNQAGATSRNIVLNEFGGNVGINTNNPTTTLDVNGVIRTRNDSPVKPTAGQWTAFSDERIKTNIQLADTSQCYETMKAINLYHYRYIDAFYSTNTVQDKGQLGFIAQTVSSIFPKAVSTIAEYGYDDLLTLNPTQIHLAHYGATRRIMSKVEEQSTILDIQQSTILSQTIEISTLNSKYESLFITVSTLAASAQQPAP